MQLESVETATEQVDRVHPAQVRWTKGHLDDLRLLWDKGLSASEIARSLNGRFNTSFSRSAVLGQVYRQQLSIRVDRHSSRIAAAALIAKLSQPRVRRRPKVDAAPAVDTEIPQTQRKTLLELERGMCRWPVGNPDETDFFFCGGDVVPGRSYCPGHYVRAYQPRRRPDPARHSFPTQAVQ